MEVVLSSDPEFDGLPEDVTLPCRVVVDTIVGDDGYITVTSSKGVVQCRISLEWLVSVGIQEEEGFECTIKDGELVITKVCLSVIELAELRKRVREYFVANPTEKSFEGH